MGDIKTNKVTKPMNKWDDFFKWIKDTEQESRAKRIAEAKTPEERRNLERRFQAEDERAKHPMMVIPE